MRVAEMSSHSSFHKSFPETSYEAVTVICGRVLIVSILNTSVQRYGGETFSKADITQVPEELAKEEEYDGTAVFPEPRAQQVTA